MAISQISLSCLPVLAILGGLYWYISYVQKCVTWSAGNLICLQELCSLGSRSRYIIFPGCCASSLNAKILVLHDMPFAQWMWGFASCETSAFSTDLPYYIRCRRDCTALRRRLVSIYITSLLRPSTTPCSTVCPEDLGAVGSQTQDIDSNALQLRGKSVALRVVLFLSIPCVAFPDRNTGNSANVWFLLHRCVVLFSLTRWFTEMGFSLSVTYSTSRELLQPHWGSYYRLRLRVTSHWRTRYSWGLYVVILLTYRCQRSSFSCCTVPGSSIENLETISHLSESSWDIMFYILFVGCVSNDIIHHRLILTFINYKSFLPQS
jgi:hypothetical protein